MDANANANIGQVDFKWDQSGDFTINVHTAKVNTDAGAN